MKASRGNQLNLAVINASGFVRLCDAKPSLSIALRWRAMVFIAGTILFCVSIYAAVLLGLPALMAVTPIGAMAVMLAWLLLIVAGASMRSKA